MLQEPHNLLVVSRSPRLCINLVRGHINTFHHLFRKSGCFTTSIYKSMYYSTLHLHFVGGRRRLHTIQEVIVTFEPARIKACMVQIRFQSFALLLCGNTVVLTPKGSIV